uniref:Uncharacterized protein n=1 Tax=Anopheles merus TaxID=30066 RepID=A0A182V2N5_ANOME
MELSFSCVSTCTESPLELSSPTFSSSSFFLFSSLPLYPGNDVILLLETFFFCGSPDGAVSILTIEQEPYRILIIICLLNRYERGSGILYLQQIIPERLICALEVLVASIERLLVRLLSSLVGHLLHLQLDVLIISSQDLAHYRTVTVFADLQDLPTSSTVEWELQHIGSRSMLGTGIDKWVDNQIGLRVGPPVRADYRDRLRPEQDLRPAALLQDGMGDGRRDGSATIARDRFRRRFQYERRLLAIIRHRNAIERVVLLDGRRYRDAPNHRSVGRRGPGSHHYHWVGGLGRA